MQQRDDSDFKGDLDFFHIEGDHNCCRISSGEYECDPRFGIRKFPRL